MATISHTLDPYVGIDPISYTPQPCEILEIDSAAADETHNEQTVSSFTHPTFSILVHNCYVSTTVNYVAESVGGGALPTWLSYDPSTRTFDIADDCIVGSYDIQLKAYVQTDVYDEENTFTLTIVPLNIAPVLAGALTDDSINIESTG